MKTAVAIVLTTTAMLLAPESAEAHGFLSQPKAQYTGGASYTSYNAEFTASVNKAFAGRPFNWSPEQNTAQFTEAWPKTGYKSLRELMDKYVPTCGYTRTDIAPVDVSRMSSMKFQNNEYKEGFLNSHHGPCEGWIDNTRVFHYDDCVKNFPGYPAVIRMSFKACKGTCRFTFYWLALHSQKWQAYKHCVPIKYAQAKRNLAIEGGEEGDDIPQSYSFNSTTK